jgi:outer membrane autotransporter protein
VGSGFVVYDLVFRAARADFDLVALPDTAGFEMTRAPAAAREYVRHGEDAWSSRTAEIRDAGSARGDGWEFWAQAYAGGRRLERTTDFALPGGLTSGPQALTLDNDWHGLQLGADRRMGEVLVGFTGGIQQQETRVRADLNGFDLSGGNLGAYAGVSSGPFFLNGLARGDWWSTDARMRTVGADTSFDGRAVTAKVETGLRLGGPKLRFEPLADLAWSRVSLDDAAFGSLATRFRFADVDGWTGSLGARVGGTWGLTSPWIGAYWVGGSGGDADVTMLTGAGCPSCVTLTDARPKNYGLVDFGFTSGTGWRGLEGFARGEALFGADTSGFAARAGVRWRW